MADEIYERITYDTPHEAFACLPGMWERTMTVSGAGAGERESGGCERRVYICIYIRREGGRTRERVPLTVT